MTNSDSVTISLLPVSLSLVHLPRSRLDHFTTHVLRQILLPNPTFLNVTCNEVEVSLFAEHDTLQEFHNAARKDARKLRQRERATRAHAAFPQRARRASEDWEPVEVASERWKVLQIDSHSDCIDNSGARVHELSAPLAAAGISILYQSSYMSDFIFVNESRLAEVMTLLGSAGFDIYLSDPTHLTAQLSAFTSPLLSPAGEDDPQLNYFELHSGRNSFDFDTDGGIVFTRSRSNTSGTASSSGSHSRSGLSPSKRTDRPEEAEKKNRASPIPEAQVPSTRSTSHSPSACDVRVLTPDITCVGLSTENAETWGLKIVKLLAFPELIVGPSGAPVSERRARPRTPSSPVSVLSALPEDQFRVLSFGRRSEEEAESVGSDTTTRVAPESPKKDLGERSGSESPAFDDPKDQDDPGLDADEDEESERESGRAPRPHLHYVDTLRHQQNAPLSSPRSRSRSQSTASSASDDAAPPLVPFFSFTRTSEGSSLAAPVSLLAALFPASERHMVMCSEELDVVDSRNASPERWAEVDEGASSEDDDDEDGDGDGALPEPEGMLKCLQIDLRKFGLEKHGLVNRFSRTLEENGINHMYSSTYKTANLLVDKAHAGRAQALLRSC